MRSGSFPLPPAYVLAVAGSFAILTLCGDLLRIIDRRGQAVAAAFVSGYMPLHISFRRAFKSELRRIQAGVADWREIPKEYLGGKVESCWK